MVRAIPSGSTPVSIAMPLSSGNVSSTPPMRLSRAPNQPTRRKARTARRSLVRKRVVSAIVSPDADSALAERPPHPDLLPLKGEKGRKRPARLSANKLRARPDDVDPLDVGDVDRVAAVERGVQLAPQHRGGLRSAVGIDDACRQFVRVADL